MPRQIVHNVHFDMRTPAASNAFVLRGAPCPAGRANRLITSHAAATHCRQTFHNTDFVCEAGSEYTWRSRTHWGKSAASAGSATAAAVAAAT